jgi:type VI secretion system protein ImpG
VSDYIGTDLFLSLGQRSDPEALDEVAELAIEALCTNRHLAEHLPVGEGAVDFRLVENSKLELRCIAGPTRPREPAMTAMVGKGADTTTGDVAWRLISLLGLNHLSLVERRDAEGARALRETLALFADPNDGASEIKLRGVRSIDARPVTRRMRQGSGAAVARGLEITVTLEDKAFEGSGAFLFGAVLDRYFAEYVAINHFTQTVVRTIERKEIMRWPPRIGLRGVM